MKRFGIIFWMLAIVAMTCSPAASQVTKKQQEFRSEVEAKTGKTVRLFHSGTRDVKKTFCVGDVIPVYREVYASGAIKRTKVGKIKVRQYLEGHYLVAEVVEGKIRRGDVAQKESAFCLVYPAPDEE